MTIHHIQVSSDLFLSSAATRADELKRREAVTDRGVGALSFSFLFLFPFLLSPLLPRSHPHSRALPSPFQQSYPN